MCEYSGKFVQMAKMETKFIKNIQFTKLIKVDGRLKEFNFRKSNSSREGIFTIDVIDDRGNRIIFNMENSENRWKIIPMVLPAWVVSSESMLEEIIDQEFKQA